MRHYVALITTIAAVACATCGFRSRDLSREKAKELIAPRVTDGVRQGKLAWADNSGSLQTTVVIGQLEQLWTVPKSNDALTDFTTRMTGQPRELSLTPAGREIFSAITFSQMGGINWDSDVTLTKPVKITVLDVTGMRKGDSEDKRTAEFSWRYEGPRTVLRYLGLSMTPGQGQAEFQLYDDGWRLTTLDLKPVRMLFLRDPQAEALGRAAKEQNLRTIRDKREAELEGSWRGTLDSIVSRFSGAPQISIALRRATPTERLSGEISYENCGDYAVTFEGISDEGALVFKQGARTLTPAVPCNFIEVRSLVEQTLQVELTKTGIRVSWGSKTVTADMTHWD